MANAGPQECSDAAVQVRSAGLRAGNYAQIFVDGKLIGKDQGLYECRGMNVVVLDAVSHAIKAAGCFDTHWIDADAERLAAFLLDTKNVATGDVVLMAVRDSAARFLGESTSINHVGAPAAGRPICSRTQTFSVRSHTHG